VHAHDLDVVVADLGPLTGSIISEAARTGNPPILTLNPQSSW
jgi:hypothetical protein